MSTDNNYISLESKQPGLKGFLKRNKNPILGVLMGITFGFLISRAGATTYDYHAKMFLFIDFQLMQVIGTAIVVAMMGVFLLKRYHVHSVSTGQEVDFVKKPYQQG